MDKPKRRIMVLAAAVATIALVCLLVAVGVVAFNHFAQPSASAPVADPVESVGDNVPAADSTVAPAPAVARVLPTVTPTATLDPLTAIAANDQAAQAKHLNFRRAIVYTGVAIAEYDADLNAMPDNAEVIKAAGGNLVLIAPSILSGFKDVTAVETCVWAPVKDTTGGTKDQVVVRLRATRVTATKIDWSKLDIGKLDRILTGKGDIFYLIPAWKTTWTKVRTP